MVKIKIPYQIFLELESCTHSAFHTLLWSSNRSLMLLTEWIEEALTQTKFGPPLNSNNSFCTEVFSCST